ncbi:nucleolar complex protein 2 [Paragonimus westermani]|uniref:Nucleolar complex protein 2 n=1 Tax=Paragonimus westermani TaxID=34504 RepID=A0A5J4NC78_9TREM|nr:nucleolar complex protein 2 [Paragonimus westermani]
MSATLKTLLKEPVPDLKKINNITARLMSRPKMQKTYFKVLIRTNHKLLTRSAFLNLLKAVEIKPECFGLCIKFMFVAYVRNSKFVVGSTIAHINFMRLSLVEFCSKNLDEAYLHAFVYVRQLAIGLRKAYSSHSKEDKQAVQNWQFINSLRLWTDFVAKYAATHKAIQSLIHPIVQILVGTTKLNPGERWIPLRFHCISMLHSLAGVPTLSIASGSQTLDTETKSEKLPLVGRALCPSDRLLVPSLPLLLDTFQLVNFNRRATSASQAPLDLRLMLHFSPSQRKETSSLDAIVGWLFDLLAESAAIQANSVAFPEFVLPLVNELKHFCHTCRVASFTRQMKALQVKLTEHSDWISIRRRCLRNLANPEELAIPDESDESKGKFKRDLDSVDSDASDSDISNASYDMDDGTAVIHVSKSKKESAHNKTGKPIGKTKSEPLQSEDDSDFDLEAVLKESEEEKSEPETAPDEVTDFELSDSGESAKADEEMEEINVGETSEVEPSRPSHKTLKSKKVVSVAKRKNKRKPGSRCFLNDSKVTKKVRKVHRRTKR